MRRAWDVGDEPIIEPSQTPEFGQRLALSVEQTVKVELVINLIVAKTLGLSLPLTLFGRADAVIE